MSAITSALQCTRNLVLSVLALQLIYRKFEGFTNSAIDAKDMILGVNMGYWTMIAVVLVIKRKKTDDD